MMTRKEFLRSIAGAGVGAAGLTALAACGDDGGSTPPPDTAQASCTASIGTNHGHTMSVSRDDVMAGAEKTYQIQGSSGHPHTVVVTAAMFTMLQNNTAVMVRSSMDDLHDHQVTINCT
jgi:hypothetical protein